MAYWQVTRAGSKEASAIHSSGAPSVRLGRGAHETQRLLKEGGALLSLVIVVIGCLGDCQRALNCRGEAVELRLESGEDRLGERRGHGSNPRAGRPARAGGVRWTGHEPGRGPIFC